jgi:signal peptidase II
MLVWIILSIALLAIDQISKALVVLNFHSEHSTVPIIQDFFHFTYTRNNGVVFGMADDQPWILPVVILAALGATALFIVLFLKNDFHDKRTRWYSASLALLVAGTLGNAIDRIFQVDHAVIDFIDFRGIWSYIFNIADMCLCVGIGLFLFDQLILDPKRGKKNDPS